MTGQRTDLICEAFKRLGPRPIPLAGDGFRLRAGGKQTCAVYFQKNHADNIVEIGLSPVAIAPQIGRTVAEIETWVRQQATITGRERIKSGNRGSYRVGVAFGSDRELEAFLDAWRAFQNGINVSSSDRTTSSIFAWTLIQQAGSDSGFDLAPERQGNWLILHSTAFPYQLGVSPQSGETYLIGVSDASWGMKNSTTDGLRFKMMGNWLFFRLSQKRKNSVLEFCLS
jgi:hypothetical protein